MLEVNSNPQIDVIGRDSANLGTHLPVIVYRAGLVINDDKYLIGEIRRLAIENHWRYDWMGTVEWEPHFHYAAHEALVVVRGSASLNVGGTLHGFVINVVSGDVIAVPARVLHYRLQSSEDFAVCGLCPQGQQRDMNYPTTAEQMQSRPNVVSVPRPDADPILGLDGPMMELW